MKIALTALAASMLLAGAATAQQAPSAPPRPRRSIIRLRTIRPSCRSIPPYLRRPRPRRRPLSMSPLLLRRLPRLLRQRQPTRMPPSRLRLRLPLHRRRRPSPRRLEP